MFILEDDNNSKNNGSVSYFNHHIDFEIPDILIGGTSQSKWTLGGSNLYKIGTNTGVNDFTEVISKYKIADDFALAFGYSFGKVVTNNNSSNFNKFLGGIVYSKKLSDTDIAYASFLRGDEFIDWRIGDSYALSDKSYIDVSYRKLKFKNSITIKGIEAGIGFYF